MSFLDKILKVLGFESEEQPKEQKQQQSVCPKEQSECLTNNNDISSIQQPLTSNKLFNPTSQSEVQQVIEHLKQNGQAHVDFGGLTNEDLTRCMDFLCGAVFALNLNIEQIEDKKYNIFRS